MKIKFIERILDRIDEKKKEEALAVYPFSYKDRHGKRWFNPDYCKGFCDLRKWC